MPIDGIYSLEPAQTGGNTAQDACLAHDKNYEIGKRGNSVTAKNNYVAKNNYNYALPDSKEPTAFLSVLYLAADPRTRVLERIQKHELSDLVESELAKCDNLDPDTKTVNVMQLGAKLVLDIAEETHVLERALENSKSVQYKQHLNIRGSEIEKRVKDCRPDILQLSCHCTGDSFVVCSDLAKGYDSVSGGEFVKMFTRIKYPPKMIVLSCCNAEKIARELLKKTAVMAVIYASGKLKDAESILFVDQLYKGVFGGETIKDAWEAARSVARDFLLTARDENSRNFRFYAYNKNRPIKSNEIYSEKSRETNVAKHDNKELVEHYRERSFNTRLLSRLRKSDNKVAEEYMMTRPDLYGCMDNAGKICVP